MSKECMDVYREETVRLRARIAQLETELNTNRNARNALYAENQRLRTESDALRADRERLDWLNEHDPAQFHADYSTRPERVTRVWRTGITYHKDIRSAIDAARGVTADEAGGKS